MSEKRILIPLKELKPGNIRLCRMADDKEMYNAIENYLTRPVTQDDVRWWKEWTEEERMKVKNMIDDAENTWSSTIVAMVLDIALRPAPEHKPCPFCGGEATCEAVGSSGQMKEYYVTCSTCDCVIATHVTYFEAWAAWDKRKEDE